MTSRNPLAAQVLERAVLPLFAFGLMRAHGTETVNLKREVAKQTQFVKSPAAKMAAYMLTKAGMEVLVLEAGP